MVGVQEVPVSNLGGPSSYFTPSISSYVLVLISPPKDSAELKYEFLVA